MPACIHPPFGFGRNVFTMNLPPPKRRTISFSVKGSSNSARKPETGWPSQSRGDFRSSLILSDEPVPMSASHSNAERSSSREMASFMLRSGRSGGGAFAFL